MQIKGKKKETKEEEGAGAPDLAPCGLWLCGVLRHAPSLEEEPMCSSSSCTRLRGDRPRLSKVTHTPALLVPGTCDPVS